MPYIRIFLARWYELLQLIYKQKSPAGSIISLVSNHIWLVVDLPLWKIVYSQLGWFFPIYGKKHVPNHQPVIIRCWNHWKTILTVDPKGRKGDPSENWWFLTAGEMDDVHWFSDICFDNTRRNSWCFCLKIRGNWCCTREDGTGFSPNFQTKPRLKSKSNDDGLSEHFESAAHLLSFSPPVIIFGVV